MNFFGHEREITKKIVKMGAESGAEMPSDAPVLPGVGALPRLSQLAMQCAASALSDLSDDTAAVPFFHFFLRLQV